MAAADRPRRARGAPARGLAHADRRDCRLGAIGRSQPLSRWCLRTGYRTMRPGDLLWAYLSVRQQVCAVGTVSAVVHEGSDWFVEVDWDSARTRDLCRKPVPREDFGQVPMSVCRAGAVAARVLAARYEG